MKNLLLNLLTEKGNKSSSKFLMKRSMINDLTKSDAASTEYNPKTARHKSLKNVNFSFSKD